MSLWVCALVVLILPVMLYSLRDIVMHNDVAGWLPRKDPQARILSWYQGMFPSEERILVSWDGASITDPRFRELEEALEGVASDDGEIEGGSPLVSTVTLPTEVLTRMIASDIPFESALDQLDGVLIGQGPLKIRLTDAGRSRGDFMNKEILRLLNEELQLEAVFTESDLPLPSGEDIPLEEVHAWEVHDSLQAYVQDQPLYHMQVEWPNMHRDPAALADIIAQLKQIEAQGSGSNTAGQACIDDCFCTPGALAAVSVSLSDAGEADKQASVHTIREAVEAIGIPAEKIRMGGRPVVTVALNESVGRAAWNNAGSTWDLPHRSPIFFSAIVTVFFSFIMLRSFRLAILVQFVAFLTVIFALAIVPMTGGSMNMVLVVMPTLLAVLTVSAAIHVANYWKHSGETDPSTSVFAATRTAWLPCVLASGTTAIGMASLVASNLVPVRNFGVYAGVGCLISFLVVLYVLPSLMLYWPKAPPRSEHLDTSHWRSLGLWIARKRHFVCGCCFVLTALAGWGLWQFQTETKVIRYFPRGSKVVQDYTFLEDKLSGVISIDTIVKFDTDAQEELPFVERARMVKALQDEMRQHPEISGVLSLASFLDLREIDMESLSFAQRKRKQMAQRSWARKIHEKIRNPQDYPDSGVASMMALPDYATDWMEPGDELLNHEGDEVWRITAQTSALSDVDLEVLIGDMNSIASSHLSLVGSPNTGHVVTGLIPVFLRTQEAVLQSLIVSFGLAFVIIAVVMMFVLRSPLAGAFTMLPNLMPVFVVFGLLSWANLKVDIGTMITASVALGIAVDGTLHLLTWFKELTSQGHSVEDAVGMALEHCGPAMWQTSAAIGLGMLALLPAELLLVSRFGWMMAALIFAALVADIVFLPALLGGFLGRLIRNAVYVEAAEEDGDPPTVSLTEELKSREKNARLKDVS